MSVRNMATGLMSAGINSVAVLRTLRLFFFFLKDN